MAIDTTDIVTDTDVRAILEDRTEFLYQFRRAFRDHNATNLNSNQFNFPQGDNNLDDETVEVSEGASYTRAQLSYSNNTATYIKFGFEVPITDEAVQDSVIDVEMDNVEMMGRAMQSDLDNQAFTVLDNNNNSTTIGNDAEDLDYEAVVAAYTTLVEGGFSPSEFEFYVSADGFGDLANDSNFNRATDQGDALARQGMLGETFGVPVVMTNTGDLVDDEGFMVDTSRYGWESTRMDTEVDSYREDQNDQTVYKVRWRGDFVSTNNDAAIFVQGGASGA